MATVNTAATITNTLIFDIPSAKNMSPLKLTGDNSGVGRDPPQLKKLPHQDGVLPHTMPRTPPIILVALCSSDSWFTSSTSGYRLQPPRGGMLCATDVGFLVPNCMPHTELHAMYLCKWMRGRDKSLFTDMRHCTSELWGPPSCTPIHRQGLCKLPQVKVGDDALLV